MNIKPICVSYNINRKFGYNVTEVISIECEEDFKTRYIDVHLYADNVQNTVDISGSIVKARMVTTPEYDSLLLSDNVACEVAGTGHIIIPIDSAVIAAYPCDFLVEVHIQNGENVLVLPFPLWVSMRASILDNAGVTPESQGTVPKLLKDATKALEDAETAIENAGDYDNLENKPSINGVTLDGNKTTEELNIETGVTVSSAVVNQNGTITFTMSDGSVVTTTGESVIGPKGDNYNLTNQDKSGIADIVLGDLKSTLNGTVDLIGDTTIYNVSLAESGTGVGANWNFYYDKSLPKGTKLNFYLSAYTGVLFTNVLVRFYDTTNTLRSLAPSVMQTGKLQTYTLFEDCTRIWVQINRSAPENGVSAQFIMSFDTSGLSADVAKIQSVLPTNTQEVLKSSIQKYVGKRFKNNGVEEDTESGWITSDYLPVGLGITVTGYSYSSTRPGIVVYNASKQTLGVVAGNGEYVTRTYTPPTNVAYVRLQTLASKQDTKATSIINSEPKVYRVEKNGSGDFTKLVDAINEAVRYMDSVVYVGAGTWDIIDELGSEYVESVSITQRGLYLKNRVRVICSSNSLITCNYTGSRADTISWLSAFNAGPLGFTLENATIESSNCRYAIHDERDQDADEYNNYYINCKIKHDNTDGGYNQCIGGGLGLNGHVIIDGCIFENPARTNYQIVYYHNSTGSGKSFVEVKGSYFKGTNTLGFQWYGSSPATQKSTLFAHGNSLGSAIQHTGASGATVENTEVISFNNEIRQGPAGADGQQGPAGADWVPTEAELNDIAQRAVNLIPTTQGVQYGN